MWGELQLNLISDKRINDKVVISGHPRFCFSDLDIYKDEILRIRKKYKDFILINTNFAFGNHLKGDDFVLSNYSRISEITTIISNDKIKLDSFILLIKVLADRGYTVVLRPHPEENPDVYRNLALNKRNFYLEEFSLSIPFILAAKCSIHCDCTTGVESFFLGKSTFSYQPKELEKKFITVLPTLVSNCFDEIGDLLIAIGENENLGYRVNQESVFKYILNPCSSLDTIINDIISNFYEKLISLNIFKFSVLVFVVNFLFKYNILKLNNLVLHKAHFRDKIINSFNDSQNDSEFSVIKRNKFLIIKK
jgi:hypothetical protein